jgi:PTH1 family peptidyl-tRNA hydrolase
VKLIVGLGNPGPEYAFSPHNLGFAVIDRLAERHSVSLRQARGHARCGRLRLEGHELWLVEPQGYMNNSGAAVREWLRMEDCGPESVLVVADDLDLPQGSIRIRQRGSSGGHHGLESIMEAIGSKEFPRLRIGIAPWEALEDPVAYLLRPMRSEQKRQMQGVVELAADAVETIALQGVAAAMNRFNRRSSAPDAAVGPPAGR